ncbi:putative phytol kinase, chloroplast precursor, carboxyterminal half [Tribonema minus]|uniref:Putative phytol kinase, chloroplast, carboxyterminal half n=1 Tax=Tribonema minus TaxID=303371 RepID=A0A835Z6B9_9STRA|nr:putative phytol kinase, chloroplast precursor, carboxyterminal half [Tribonema minus]
MGLGMGMGLSGGLGVHQAATRLIGAFTPPSTVSPVSWDVGMAVACIVLSTVWVQLWSVLVQQGKLPSTVSRKVVHCSSGPLFLLFWPFFSPAGRYMAAAVPLLQATRLTLAGFAAAKSGSGGGFRKQNPLVQVVSRSGSASEAVGGPLLYVLVLAVATILEWRASLVGVMAVCQMAAGDGLADLVGRHVKGKKWWFSEHKSYVGSLAFVAGGFVVSLALVGWLHALGCIAVSAQAAALRVLGISAVCAVVEAVAMDGVDDNVSVPVAAAVLTRVLFPGL